MSTKKICAQCGAEFGPEQRFCPNDGTPLRPVNGKDPLIGQVIAERYQILELLGEGGMGRVYLAEHVRMGRRSAVKVMSPNLALAADAITRFNREAANASRINHPNVAQIYDFGETADGVLYLAMEFIEGDTLRTIVERDGALPLDRAGQIIKQVGDALGAAHHMGIVHRDLKPDNIMLARHIDGSDWVKVVDFGIAKTVQGSGEGQTVTTAGVSLGTPEYMSPEQLAGDRLDHRSDIYSLGLVCFNLLTASLPYPRVTSRETLVRRLTSKPQSLAEIHPGFEWPPALQAALDHALAPDPADRYASAAEFGRDVTAAVAAMGDAARTVRITPAAGKVDRPSDSAETRPIGRGSTRKLEQPASPARKRGIVPIVLGVAALAAAAAIVLVVSNRSAGSNAPVSTVVAPPAATVASNTTLPADTAVASKVDSSAPPAPPKTAPIPKTAPAKKAAPPPAVKQVEPAAPARLAGAPDSIRADSVPPTGAGRRGGFRHSFLGVNGDSSRIAELPTNASDAQRIAIMRQDIQGHMGRVNTFLLNHDLLHARTEMREVVPVVRMLNELYPDVPQTRQVNGLVRLATLNALASCRTLIADTAVARTVPPAFRCESMGQGLPGGRGRAAAGVPR